MFPFDGTHLIQVQQKVLGMGHLLCVFPWDQWNWDPAEEKKFLEHVRAERHYALLAFCTPIEPNNEVLLDQLENAGVRVIHIGHHRLAAPDRSYILPDYRGGGALAVRTLMAAGYEDLYFAGMSPDGPFGQLPHLGFLDAIQAQRGAVDRAQSFIDVPAGAGDLHLPEVVAGMEQFVRNLTRPTGLVCRSHNLADHFYQLAQGCGISVPDQLGIISISHLLEDRAEPVADTIDFDWESLVKGALARVEQPVWRRVHEWMAPGLTRRGTVRGGMQKM